jgi:hypothetical protein
LEDSSLELIVFLTYEKLDITLMDTEWEDKYPLVSIRALERIVGL